MTRGAGQNGWGMLTGYTQEEVVAMRGIAGEQLLGYLDEVYDVVEEYLATTAIEKLLTSSGFEGKYTEYQCIHMALLDNVRHMGEIFAIKARWDRHLNK
ncbi:MAG: hypothetical protein ACM3PY_07360 [Omnitrophica WOR_2 bacterium]